MLSIKTGFALIRGRSYEGMVCGLLSVLGKDLHFLYYAVTGRRDTLIIGSAAGVTAMGFEQITFWSNL
jgi:hypothetical protein